MTSEDETQLRGDHINIQYFVVKAKSCAPLDLFWTDCMLFETDIECFGGTHDAAPQGQKFDPHAVAEIGWDLGMS